MIDHYILDASNNELTVTNLFGSNSPTHTLGAVPLGTVGDSATGELGTKVILVGSTAGAIVLGAGSAIIGKVSIDQTTPGTTNAVQEKQSSAVPSSFAVATATGTVFTLAAGERGFIQNLDDATLHVKLGASASTSSFNFLLKASAAADDGSGGYISIENWIGAVSVAPSTGAARYVAWKI